MPRRVAWIVGASERLRAASRRMGLLSWVADSLYVSAVKSRAMAEPPRARLANGTER
jgi:hypothetical protein